MQDRRVKVQVKNLTKAFGDLLVLDDVSFDVYDGEFLCIVGPTGCGKTTFLNSMTKIYEPSQGSIRVDGEEINPQRHNLAYIFQEYSTMEWLNIQENVEFGLKAKKFPKERLKERSDYVIRMVGLDKYRNYYPSQLSASMLQRVVIARAFAIEPDLLLMDEPYGQMDIKLRFYLEDEVLRLWKEMGTTVVFVTHNIEEAVYLSEKILILTNKPAGIKEELVNRLPYPRDITSPDFIEMRRHVTDQIKWW